MPHGGLSTHGGGGTNEPLAVVALSLGLFAAAFNCCCGVVSILFGAAAVVFGLVSLSTIAKEPHKFSSSSKGMAIAGIVLGGLGAVAQIGILVFSIAIPFAFGP